MRPAVGVLFFAAALSHCGPGPTVSGRKAEIRQIISKNRHFNIHCWCFGPDDRTVEAVLAVAHEEDIGILAELLADPNDSVALGAQGALISLASADLAKIRPSVPREKWLDHDVFEETAAPSVRALQRVEAGGANTRARAIASDALIQVALSERHWRETHPPASQD